MRQLCAFLIVMSLCDLCLADDLEQIKEAVVFDSAMSSRLFHKWANGHYVIPFNHHDHALTQVLLHLPVLDAQSKKAGFQFLFEGPKPPEIAEEIYRVRKTGRSILIAPVTLLHADRITNFECEIQGQEATGRVTFMVPRICKGVVEFEAEFRDSMWVITEFRVPDRDVYISRSYSGLWAKKL